ncbi:MAG: Jag N-terminal domain-containing protein [Candidatus Omnitrophica bacterium]|nr:Jag N-terminal domain-containing protein [Candidatus Omnitrophota bacterium]
METIKRTKKIANTINTQSKVFEFEGDTVDEAIKNALRELSIAREEIIIKVVSEEKKGLFGLSGGSPAKISVKSK